MKGSFSLFQQYISYILLVSFFLQSCGGGFDNTPLISTEEEQIASIQTNTQATLFPTNIQPLTGQVLTAQGGHAITFYEEAGQLKANVEMNAPQGFSKSYDGLGVYIEQGSELSDLPRLGQQAQQRRIHLQPAHAGETAKIVIYKGAGLAGGGKEKKAKKTVLPGEEEENSQAEPENKIIDWAPPYDFTNTSQEWEEQLKILRNYTSAKFWEIPDFKQESWRITKYIDPNNDLDISHPLIGIVWFRTVAKRIGLLPIKESYTQEEIEFIRKEILKISMALQGNMNDFKWVSHELRDLTSSDIEKAEKSLDDKMASKKHKKEALKKLLYAKIPWRALEGLGKFALKFGKNKYVADDQKVFKDALPNLIKEFRVITHALGNIIHFYQEEIIGEIKFCKPNSVNFPTVIALGSFIRDQISLENIRSLIDVFISSSPEKDIPQRNRYALLRTLNIIGECSVILSCQMKTRLLAEDSWKAFKAIRNFFHDSRLQKQLHKIILDKKEDLVINPILTDFQTFTEILKKKNQWFGYNWEDILAFYDTTPERTTSNLESIIDLYRIISGYLTLSEEKELIASIKTPFTSAEEASASLKKMLLEDKEVNYNDRKSFTSSLESLKFSKTEGRNLEEPYKKRCTAQKVGKNSELSSEEKDKIQTILNKTLDGIKNKKERLKIIALKIHSYDKWYEKTEGKKNLIKINGLKKNLEELGLTTKEDLAIWKKYYKITRSRSSVQIIKPATAKQGEIESADTKKKIEVLEPLRKGCKNRKKEVRCRPKQK